MPVELNPKLTAFYRQGLPKCFYHMVTCTLTINVPWAVKTLCMSAISLFSVPRSPLTCWHFFNRWNEMSSNNTRIATWIGYFTSYNFPRIAVDATVYANSQIIRYLRIILFATKSFPCSQFNPLWIKKKKRPATVSLDILYPASKHRWWIQRYQLCMPSLRINLERTAETLISKVHSSKPLFYVS